MIVEGSQGIGANLGMVWSFITDPRNIGKCLPDVQSLEILDDNTLKAKMKFGADYVKGSFTGTFNFEKVLSSNTLVITGIAKGLGSTVNIVIRISLAVCGEMTHVNWSADIVVSGILKPVITQDSLKSLSEKLASEMFECLSVNIGVVTQS
jgi:uncharacterized protein